MKDKKRQGTSGSKSGRVRRKLDVKSSASVTVFQENNNWWHATGIRIINHRKILRHAPRARSAWFDGLTFLALKNKQKSSRSDGKSEREGKSNLRESLLHGFDRWPSLSGSSSKCFIPDQTLFLGLKHAGWDIHHRRCVYTHCTLFLKDHRGVWLTKKKSACQFQPIAELQTGQKNNENSFLHNSSWAISCLML